MIHTGSDVHSSSCDGREMTTNEFHTTPPPRSSSGCSYYALGQKACVIPTTQVATIVEPNGIADDIGWGPLAGIGGVCRYSSTDCSNFRSFTCQYQSQR